MKNFKELPEYVQDKMLYYQVKQGNERSKEVFIDNIDARFSDGGFLWSETDEGYMFWNELIVVGTSIHECCKKHKIVLDNHPLYNSIYCELNEETKNLANIVNGYDAVLKPDHYDNSKGSLYKFAEDQNLNAYEFDIIKRVTRCRKKGKFVEDLKKTKFLIDLYIEEHEK